MAKVRLTFQICMAAALLIIFQPASGSETNSPPVLEFPRPSVGRIYATTDDTDFTERNLKATNLAAAEGKVEKPKGVGFVLKLNYEGGSDLSFLNRLPADALVGLDSNDIAIDCAKLSALQHLKTLRRLDLRNADFSDKECIYLKDLPLEYIDLSKTMIRGQGLKVLKTLNHLRGLTVSFCPFDKTASAGLALAPTLRELHISSTNLKDSDMANLAKLKNLTELKASSNSQITDVGIASISGLHELRTLDLSYTNATINCLHSLKKLPGLKHLNISSPRITTADIAKMAAALPQCHVKGSKQSKLPLMLFDPLH